MSGFKKLLIPIQALPVLWQTIGAFAKTKNVYKFAPIYGVYKFGPIYDSDTG